MSFVDTYYYPISALGFSLDNDLVLSTLDANERARFERYKVDHARWAFAFARWMSKTQLSKKLGCDAKSIRFEYNQNGKPEIDYSALSSAQSLSNQSHTSAENPLFFNISHTKTAIVLVISDTPVGVDIEVIERRGQPWDAAENFLNKDLAVVLDGFKIAREKQCAFTRYWTCMEATVKYEGSTLFAVKETFGADLPLLKSDGYFNAIDKNDTISSRFYFTSATRNNEQFSICSANRLNELNLFEYNACGEVSKSGFLLHH